MYKLLVTDLDGTLLNSLGQVSAENKEAIKYAKSKGVEVVLASGRMPNTIERVAKEVNVNSNIICANGAFIYDFEENKIVYESYLEKNKALDIIKMCDENSIYYNIYTNKSVLAKSLNYNIKFIHNENQNHLMDERTDIELVQDVYSYVKENSDLNIFKITICDDNKAIFDGIIRKIEGISDIDIIKTEYKSKKEIKLDMQNIPVEYYYTEILNKNTNKWQAIEYLLKKFNISKEEVIAIGDNANDVEMIKNAKVGVAMGESMLEALKIGDIFVSDNNSNGVAEAIYKLI